MNSLTELPRVAGQSAHDFVGQAGGVLSTTQAQAGIDAAPAFSRPLTTGQLANRDPDAFFEAMSAAFDRRRLTNQGPLVTQLEQALAELHGTKHAIAMANACFGIILALHALALPGKTKVVMPSLTFRGLPHLIRWAGLRPHFCEIDPVRHTLDPLALARAIDDDTAAVLAVDNANALCDIDALEAVTAAAGVPLLLDAVYGVAGRYPNGDPVGSRGAAAVFSLHATKLINGFEGGYLTTDDDALATALRSQRTFGFSENGVPSMLGFNAKLNEIHAAMALSNLPHLEQIVADNRERYHAYLAAFAEIDWVSFADYRHAGQTFGLVLLRVADTAPCSRDELIAMLRGENALVRPYYHPPLHRDATVDADTYDLPVTDRVSREFIQMPVGDLVSIDDIYRLAELFRRFASRLASRAGSAHGDTTSGAGR